MTRRFLIVQLGDIGDLILSTPALAALREAHPDAHLALLTTTHAAPVVDGVGLVDDVITFARDGFNNSQAFFRPGNLRQVWGLRRGQYDTVLFFHRLSLRAGTVKFAAIGYASGARHRVGIDNGNGWFLNDRIADDGYGVKHQAQYWLDLVALSGANPSPRPAQVATAAYNLPEAAARLVIHTGSGGFSTARRWPVRHFAKVIDGIRDRYGDDVQIILVGSASDDTASVRAATDADMLDLTGQTSLAELASVISQSHVFLGADSGVMHLAAATATPVVAIFGPSNADAWGPWQPDGEPIVLRSAPMCSPCSYVGQTVGLREGCPARTCMWMVTPAQVVEALAPHLDSAIELTALQRIEAEFDAGDEDAAITRLDRLMSRYIQQGQVMRTERILSELRRLYPDSVWLERRLDAFQEALTEVQQNFDRRVTSNGHNKASAPVLRAALREERAADTPAVAPWPHRIHILGTPVDALTYDDWLDLIGQWVAADDRARQVCTTNPEFVMMAQRDPNFRNILDRADLCVPDGVGLLWAARRLGTPLPGRVTGSDGLPIIAERAAQTGWRIFLLGAAPGVADEAAAVLRDRYPGVQIVGTYSGSPAPEDEDAIVRRVNDSHADLLFVAYGAPQQDKWIARNLPRLHVVMAMGVGGSLDFIAEVVPRAPQWMRNAGLEWLYRLYLQPSRIGRMTRLPRFVLAVLRRGRR